MIRYPSSAQRPVVLLFSGVGAVATAGIALLLGVNLFNDSLGEGSLHLVSMICWEFILIGMMLTSGTIFLAIWRDPAHRKLKTEIYSEDWLLATCCLAIAVACTGGVAGMMNSLNAGEADSVWMAWGMIAFVGLFAAVGWLGFTAILWNNVRRGRSKLVLESNPVPAGNPLRAVLEIPFSHELAPDVQVTLDLRRHEQDVSSENSPTQQRVYADTLRITKWHPAGDGRCCTSIEIELPGGQPCDLEHARVSYSWSLTAEPAENDVPWNAHFTLPVRFEGETDEPRALPA